MNRWEAENDREIKEKEKLREEKMAEQRRKKKVDEDIRKHKQELVDRLLESWKKEHSI